MASTFTATMDIRVALTQMLSDGLQQGALPVEFLSRLRMATGTSDGQINKGWYKKYTGIGSSVTTSIDLVGALTDNSAATINFDEVVLLAIRNLSSTAANYLEVGPHATNGFGILTANRGWWKDVSDRSIIPADATTTDVGGGGWTIWYSPAGIPAAAGSTDILSIATGGSASGATFEVLILGRDN